MLTTGGISFYTDSISDVYSYTIPTVTSPLTVSTELFGTAISIDVMQKLIFNRLFSVEDRPNANGWVYSYDNGFSHWQYCADEWAFSIENGYYGSSSCMDNGGYGGGVYPGLFSISLNTNPTKVPEPGSSVLLALGLVGLGFSRKKRGS
jgi:hypothetical protein